MENLTTLLLAGAGACYLVGLFAWANGSRWQYLLFGMMYMLLASGVFLYFILGTWFNFGVSLLALIIAVITPIMARRKHKQKIKR